MNKNKKVNELIEKLLALGEDKDELWFWQEYFELMSKDGQKKLIENLKKEIKDLELLKK